MLEWVKAFHIISVIAWMTAMLYLPRLFVYHAEAGAGTPQSETFKIMERRLLRAIATPAMIATWIFGLWLLHLYGSGILGQGWIWLKIAMVLGLSGIHGMLAKHQKSFARDENTKSAKYFRVLNEVPTILMILIVIAVVVKPF